MQELKKADDQGVLLAGGQSGVLTRSSAVGVLAKGRSGVMVSADSSGVLSGRFGLGAVSPDWVVWSYVATPPEHAGEDASIAMSITMARSVDNLDFTLIDGVDTIRSSSSYEPGTVQTWSKMDIGPTFQGRVYDFRIRVTLKGVLFDAEVIGVDVVTIPDNNGEIEIGGGEN